MGPLKAIRLHCSECYSGLAKECSGRLLDDTICLLHPYRMGKGRVRLKVIKAYCLKCTNGKLDDCIGDCTLQDFKYGTNPNRKGIGNVFNFVRNK